MKAYTWLRTTITVCSLTAVAYGGSGGQIAAQVPSPGSGPAASQPMPPWAAQPYPGGGPSSPGPAGSGGPSYHGDPTANSGNSGTQTPGNIRAATQPTGGPSARPRRSAPLAYRASQLNQGEQGLPRRYGQSPEREGTPRGMPPSMMGGMPPQMGGGMPPQMGGMPPQMGGMPPQMGGGMPPGMMGGMPPQMSGGMPPGMMGGMPPQMGGGMGQASPAGFPGPSAFGPGGVAPASHTIEGPANGPYYSPGGEMMGGGFGQADSGGTCPACQGVGCDYCQGEGDGFAAGLGLLHRLAPYGAGGWCAPRWFDVSVEAMQLTREDVSRRVDFMSLGPAGFGEPFVVLSTDDLDFDEAEGFRVTLAMQLGASANLELSYFGTFNFVSSASVFSADDDLFSVISDFGSNPPPQSNPIVFGGFSDTDGAQFAGIEYSSGFDSIELDYRKRWLGANCRVQGSWMLGVRYFQLDEEFAFNTIVDRPDPNPDPPPPEPTNPPITGFLNNQIATSNALTGFQGGGDLWVTLIPGVRFGGDLKGGIYGNHAEQRTVFFAQSLADPVVENVDSDRVAFIGEAQMLATWRVNENLTIRGGYEFLYVDGVALAPENFNAQPPFLAGARTPTIDTNGDVFYHGLTGGIEWMW